MKTSKSPTLALLVLGLPGACFAEDEAKTWTIASQDEWKANLSHQEGLEIADGQASPSGEKAVYQSKLRIFSEKRQAGKITLSQSPAWQNWEDAGNIGPANASNAPVFLRMGPQNYWIFAAYGREKQTKGAGLPATLEGFDMPLLTSSYPNQFIAPGGLTKRKAGYHGWQSRDMLNWVYHGQVTARGCVTTAELVDGKAYIYYDYPNDQDPHLVIEEDLIDGVAGKDMGMAFADPSHGSDCAVIRDLEGRFHLIYEDWSPIDASKHAWDSPLAGHAVSEDGKGGFRIVEPAVDERTNPTGKFGEYFHPHWYRTAPEKFPGKVVTQSIPQHRIKEGEVRSVAEYEIHEPEQNAYGDWSAISIGGQYYLFCDFDPAGGHGKQAMSVAWFTSSDINKPFTFCGNIGQGHPDPDIMFAEGMFYLITQTNQDFVSPGPWVDGVEVRVGVDTDKDGSVDKWTEWQSVSERYEAIPGFAKQVAKTPAQLDLDDLPEGYGFQFELRLTDTTENESKPILDQVQLHFEP
ncbi:hypothetical protein [Haloferula rosea]